MGRAEARAGGEMKPSNNDSKHTAADQVGGGRGSRSWGRDGREKGLSPAGDGAEAVEETCEKQKRSAWWMVVLVGGSGQGLFAWETKRRRSVTSCCQGRLQEKQRIVRGPCRVLQRAQANNARGTTD